MSIEAIKKLIEKLEKMRFCCIYKGKRFKTVSNVWSTKSLYITCLRWAMLNAGEMRIYVNK